MIYMKISATTFKGTKTPKKIKKKKKTEGGNKTNGIHLVCRKPFGFWEE